MCFTRLKHLLCVTLMLVLIDKNVFYSSALSQEKSLNTSEEIKSLFHDIDVTKHIGSVLTGNKSGNFAEGGTVVTTPKLYNTSVFNLSSHNNSKISLSSETYNNFSTQEIYTPGVEKITEAVKNISDFAESTTPMTSSTTVLNKLNDTGINLYLGVPEVVHVNGTSSIKPRKGVFFNKIVPRKGVDIDNESNSNFKEPCFWVTKSECYSSVDFANIDCSCCSEGNNLGKIILQQSVLNCSFCKPLTSHPLESKSPCQNLCCSNKLLDKESYSISTSEDSLDKSHNFSHNISENKTNIIKKENISESKLLKKPKLKPTITKVPYDVEAVTGLLGKPNKEVFVPVVVSIFLLPLLGVVVYFVWRRTKDYWEKRYYKRMDFLIDGMYND